MDMQNVARLDIPEGEVRTIHDKDGNLIWGKVDYGVKYKGDTAQNGTPTPSNPVAVQTVTGEQTISINGAAHTVNLGSVELCKIGAYQDYIYKSGGKWYVHKDFGKVVFTGSAEENWFKSSSSTSSVFVGASNVLRLGIKMGASNECKSDYFIVSGTIVAGTFGLFNGTSTYQFIRLCVDASTYADITAFTNWLNSHNTTFYYPLATPTDTIITNQALVAQLEAVEQWLTRYGYNATVTGNLPIIIDRTAL